MHAVRRIGLLAAVFLVACWHERRGAAESDTDATAPTVSSAVALAAAMGAIDASAPLPPSSGSSPPVAVGDSDAVDATAPLRPVGQQAEVCCSPHSRPSGAIEGAACCADGSWALNQGDGTPTCGTRGLGHACGEIDRRAASASMGSVDVSSCSQPTGPRGQGHIKVTFAPNGSVQSAAVDHPSDYVGTPIAKCIEAKFRANVRVPPFSGKSVTVGRTFGITIRGSN